MAGTVVRAAGAAPVVPAGPEVTLRVQRGVGGEAASGVLIGPGVTIVLTGNTIDHGTAGTGGTGGGGVKADDGIAAPTITRSGGGS
jgi:hypothetical protein